MKEGIAQTGMSVPLSVMVVPDQSRRFEFVPVLPEESGTDIPQ